ncbi:hypothetical protein LINPERPRIM_LOCUS33957 [Linum perenne]
MKSLSSAGKIAVTEDRRSSKCIAYKARVFYIHFDPTSIPPKNTTNAPKAKNNLFTSLPSSSIIATSVPLVIEIVAPPVEPKGFKMEERLLREYGRPTIDGTVSCIQPPAGGAHNMSIPPHMINMIQGNVNTFSGEAHEDPNAHIKNFTWASNTISSTEDRNTKGTDLSLP